MKALVDTNVWLDVFLVREPFADASGRAISLLDAPEHGLFVGATTVTTIFYLVEKVRGRKTARAKVRAMLDRAGVAGVDGGVFRLALAGDFEDYEDAVLHGAGQAANLDAIITCDTSDFDSASLRTYTPGEFIASQ